MFRSIPQPHIHPRLLCGQPRLAPPPPYGRAATRARGNAQCVLCSPATAPPESSPERNTRQKDVNTIYRRLRGAWVLYQTLYVQLTSSWFSLPLRPPCLPVLDLSLFTGACFPALLCLILITQLLSTVFTLPSVCMSAPLVSPCYVVSPCMCKYSLFSLLQFGK